MAVRRRLLTVLILPMLTLLCILLGPVSEAHALSRAIHQHRVCGGTSCAEPQSPAVGKPIGFEAVAFLDIRNQTVFIASAKWDASFTVDWGDGTINQFAINRTATSIAPFDSVRSPCSLMFTINRVPTRFPCRGGRAHSFNVPPQILGANAPT
jgi:hypothetical protein